MKIAVELPDAFETIEVEMPERLHVWFVREATSKHMTVAELLANKAAGLTVAQLESARRTGEPIAEYVRRWIISQPHEINAGHIPIGVPEIPVVVTHVEPPTPRRGWISSYYVGRANSVLGGIALYTKRIGTPQWGIYLDVTIVSYAWRLKIGDDA